MFINEYGDKNDPLWISALRLYGGSSEGICWRDRGVHPETHYRTYPQTVLKEFKGLAHAELVMMFPERFAGEVNRFVSAAN